MLQISPSAQIFVVHESVSFNMGFDGLIGFCRRILRVEPMTGAYLVFRSKTHKQLRVLVYDGDGWWLATKRFSKGSIKHWPKGSEQLSKVAARDLIILLWRGDPKGAAYSDFWSRVDSGGCV
jgi:transposase